MVLADGLLILPEGLKQAQAGERYPVRLLRHMPGHFGPCAVAATHAGALRSISARDSVHCYASLMACKGFEHVFDKTEFDARPADSLSSFYLDLIQFFPVVVRDVLNAA